MSSRTSFTVVVAAIAGGLLASTPVAAQQGAKPGPPSSGEPSVGVSPSPSPSPPVSAAPSAKPGLVAPKLVSNADVPYPEGGTGDAVVVLQLTIGADGSVTQTLVNEGENPFAAAAVTAAATWKFEPATRDGKPIKASIRFQVTFHAPKVIEPSASASASASAASASSAPPAPSGSASSAKPSGSAAPVDVLDLVVVGEKPAPAMVSMSRTEVRELPGAFGDPFRAIESMPGVTPIVSGIPFFYVRGAPPGNVGYFLDGIRVPYLYHVGLGPSVVHPGLVDRVDLYPGGYPARFGRFAGGIVSGETTPPRASLHGEGNIRLFDAGAMVETGFADGKGTVLLGGRYSYTAAVISLVAKGVRLDYRDYQARVTYDLTPKDRLSVFGFGSYDLLGQTVGNVFNLGFGSEFYRLDLRYDRQLGPGSSLRFAVTLGWDQTKLGNERNAIDQMLGTRVELRHTLSKHALLRAGADFVTDGYRSPPLKWTDPDSPTAAAFGSLFPPRTDFAGGAYGDIVFEPQKGVEITPGVRVDWFRSGDASKVAVDPRISARLAVDDHVRIIHAYGIAHQAPSFIVPVPGLTPGSLANGLQSAFQTSAGVETDLPLHVTGTFSVFHNLFFDMTDAIGTASGGNVGGSGQVLGDNRSMGHALGLEVYLRRRITQNLSGFLTYTLSRSTRTMNGLTFPATFDRTHVGNAAVSYNLGRNWRAGTRFTFYTGAPSLARVGGLIAPPPTQTPDRDPGFYRIDLRLEKRWPIRDESWVAVVLEMLNATFHKETISGQEIGPVTIPSIGVEGAL